MSKKLISLADCCVAFDGELVLDHINLYFNDREFLTLLGPSGCGKTTTLRIIGGFLTPTSGEVLFDGVRINDIPPNLRQVNTVFQRYALFRRLGDPQAEGHVLEDVQMGKQGVPLENSVDLPQIRRNIIYPHPVEQHFSRSGRQKAANDAQGCRLAAATGSEQCEELTVIYV